MSTYGETFQRAYQDFEIESLVEGDGGWSLTKKDGWSCFVRPEVGAALNIAPQDARFVMETIQASRFVGFSINGVWIWRLSDQDIQEQNDATTKAFRDEKIANLEKNREAWAVREAALPSWLRARMQSFREKGTSFELNGWGYELAVAELAVLYVQSEGQESDAVKEYAHEQGTTANQHNMAKLLASAYRADPDFDFATSPSALTPLGSGTFYENE